MVIPSLMFLEGVWSRVRVLGVQVPEPQVVKGQLMAVSSGVESSTTRLKERVATRKSVRQRSLVINNIIR